MASTLIVYGSTTGNTSTVADMIEEVLKSAGHSVTVVDAADAAPAGLCNGYDLILFGCSTWGDEDIELQSDFASLFDSFDNIGAKGKKMAVFGCGDSSYKWFCGAVDSIEEKLEQLGATTVADGLKIDGDPDDVKADIDQWAKEVAKSL